MRSACVKHAPPECKMPLALALIQLRLGTMRRRGATLPDLDHTLMQLHAAPDAQSVALLARKELRRPSTVDH